tara:strand:+ start:380 stop:532 length:153 start_codon:yes stop_codon:yes gene_type:complete
MNNITKALAAVGSLVFCGIFSASIVRGMAAERCYGPAYPVIPMCQVIQDS